MAYTYCYAELVADRPVRVNCAGLFLVSCLMTLIRFELMLDMFIVAHSVSCQSLSKIFPQGIKGQKSVKTS